MRATQNRHPVPAALVVAAIFCVAGAVLTAQSRETKLAVTLAPDSEFGAGVDWAAVFAGYESRKTYKDLVRTSDGRLIVSDTRTYNFLFFDADGRFIKKLWKRGRRDKDSRSIYGRPEWISLWDDRLLFVSELGKIRVFDFAGKEIRSATIDHQVVCFEALDEKTVALAGWTLRTNLPVLYFSAVVDLETGRETRLTDLSAKQIDEAAVRYETPEGRKVTIDLPFAMVRPFVRRLSGDRVLAGFSNWPEIEIYEKGGRRLGEFLLKTERTELNLRAYKDVDRQNKEQEERRRESLGQGRWSGSISFRYVPPTGVFYAPYYYSLNVERNDAIRVFLFPREGENPVFQVYSDSGELRGEVVVDPGELRLVFSPAAQGPVFDGEWLYALVEEKDGKGVPLRLKKFRLAAKF
jgi:hypothetical protein